MKKILTILLFILIILTSCNTKKQCNVEFVDELNVYSNEIIIVNSGEKIIKPQDRKKDGYTFLGWYLDDEAFDFTKCIEEDIVLYAKWEKIKLDDVMINYIDGLLKATTSYIPAWNKESFKGRWNYIDGVFLNSIVELYKKTNDKKYKEFFINYIDYYLDSEGNFINPQTKENGYRSGELDSVCESKILFDAYEFTNNIKYLNAIEKTFNELTNMPLTTNGINYCHKAIYNNQIWLDGMYMYAPFLARYAKYKDNYDLFIQIKNQYQYIRNNMFDEEKKLYYHGHSTSKDIFWANKATGNSSSFWLRSIGWYIVSLVDVLDYYPVGENKDYLISLLKEAIDGILLYQDSESKLFYQVVDQGNKQFLVNKLYLEGLKNKAYCNNGVYQDSYISNYLESSGSAMIAYSFIKASQNKIIDVNYYDKGKEILFNLYDKNFYDGKLNNICITAGLGPETNIIRDGSIYYYLAEPVGSNDAKGVGPFIMAYLSYLQNN